mmetsp:Transcript_40553/g.100161  ORF Transcript_40553/g.100161 Transcript_40553/m.100161 type:complete len:234 (+) Transcript_40553:3017-3718(+)
MRPICSHASSQTVRASGSDTCWVAFSRSGMICGMNTSASAGSSTSLDMLATILAHMRERASLRSWKPRLSSGVTAARAAAVTICTKTMPAYLWMVSSVLEGSIMFTTRSSRTFSISLFCTVSSSLRIVSFAWSRTCDLRSVRHEAISSIRSVRMGAICDGAFSASSPSSMSAPTTVCHFLETSKFTMHTGTITLTAAPFTIEANALTASSAAICTGLSLSERPPSTSLRRASR